MLFADSFKAAGFPGKSFDLCTEISHLGVNRSSAESNHEDFWLKSFFFFLFGFSPKEKANSSGGKGLPSAVPGPARDKWL